MVNLPKSTPASQPRPVPLSASETSPCPVGAWLKVPLLAEPHCPLITLEPDPLLDELGDETGVVLPLLPLPPLLLDETDPLEEPPGVCAELCGLAVLPR